MFSWLSVKRAADFGLLTQHLSPTEFGLQEVADWLQTHLSTAVGGVLVEHPYVDKDYRSTYYNFYAKKGAAYSPHSARLHLFMKGWDCQEEPLRMTSASRKEPLDDAAVQDGYLGFLTLRPTRIQTIGRSVIDPRALRTAKGWLIEHRHKVHVMGYRLFASGFPFMQQHGDIAVCAHTACWAVLRHYSERYSLYREVLVHDVSRLGRESDPGGLLPSLGVTAPEAERIFAAVGTFPVLVSHDRPPKNGQARFHDEMLAYLESGFPLFGIQTGRQHAVAVVGYRREKEPQVLGSDYHRRAWDYVSHLLLVDDNHHPYMPMPRVGGKRRPKQEAGIDDIDHFIVPLPEKMFLPAAAAFKFADDISADPPEHFEDLGDHQDLVTRCFVTTTASWQRFVREQMSSFQPDFGRAALELTMPQFVWVVEYATPAQRAKGQVHARMLLDATASTREPLPAFLLHDRKGALWLDRANRVPMHYQEFDSKVRTLQEMASNLRAY
jgi:hypothetical protein